MFNEELVKLKIRGWFESGKSVLQLPRLLFARSFAVVMQEAVRQRVAATVGPGRVYGS